MHRKTAVAAYFSSKQFLLFAYVFFGDVLAYEINMYYPYICIFAISCRDWVSCTVPSWPLTADWRAVTVWWTADGSWNSPRLEPTHFTRQDANIITCPSKHESIVYFVSLERAIAIKGLRCHLYQYWNIISHISILLQLNIKTKHWLPCTKEILPYFYVASLKTFACIMPSKLNLIYS